MKDIVDFIAEVTYAIWNRPGPDPDLVRRHYTPETVIHADGGDLKGAEAIVTSTRERLQAFPDFHGVIDETIWTAVEGGHRTSMRWTWTGTHLGDSVAFGPATGRRVRLTAIANCHVRGREFVEEWIATNHLARMRQLGIAVDSAPGVAPSGGPPAPSPATESVGPGAVVAQYLAAAFDRHDAEAALALCHDDVREQVGPDLLAGGAAGVRRGIEAWHERLPGARVRIDDQYWIERDGVQRVATQATITGRAGASEVSCLVIGHHDVRDGRISAIWTEFDELTLLRRTR